MPRNCRAPAEADPEDYLYPGDLTIGRASEHLSHLSRDRWFESISLQRRVNKLSVPLTTPVVRSHDPSAVERPVGRKGSDRQSAASDVRRSGRSRRTGFGLLPPWPQPVGRRPLVARLPAVRTALPAPAPAVPKGAGEFAPVKPSDPLAFF